MLPGYTPSGKVTFFGLLLMPLLGFLGAALGSYLYFLFDTYACTIVVVFPLIVGGLAGLGVLIGVAWGKIRNVGVALFFGTVLGLLAFGLTFYWGYRDLQNFTRSYYLESGRGSLSESEARQLTDEVLVKQTGHTGIYGYALFETAYTQISFTRMGRSSFDVSDSYDVPPWLSRVITVVEWLAAGLAGAIVGTPWAAFPFCEKDKRWIHEETIMKSHLDNGPDLSMLLEERDFGEMLKFYKPPDPKEAFTIVTVACAVCGEGVAKAYVDFGKDRTLFHRIEIHAAEAAALEELRKAVKALPPLKEEAKAEEQGPQTGPA